MENFTIIKNIINSASEKILRLTFNEYVLNRNYLVRINITCIRSVLEYAWRFWDGCTKRHSDNFENLQLKAGRIARGLFASHLKWNWMWITFEKTNIKKAYCVLLCVQQYRSWISLFDLFPPFVRQVSNYNLR